MKIKSEFSGVFFLRVSKIKRFKFSGELHSISSLSSNEGESHLAVRKPQLPVMYFKLGPPSFRELTTELLGF